MEQPVATGGSVRVAPVALPFESAGDQVTFTASGMSIYSLIAVAQEP